ncbi:MAG: hypothetical protein AB7F59_12185 [Bdellovibrionales bacterium]
MEFFYVEGFSEVNFIASLLRSKGIVFADDISEIVNGSKQVYLRNCKSDSYIKTALFKDKWLLNDNKQNDKRLWVVADLESFPCYTSFRTDIKDFMLQEAIDIDTVIVNSRPKLEYEYFDDIEHIKQTVLTLYNQGNPQSVLHSCNQLRNLQVLNDGSKNFSARIYEFCKENLNKYPKRAFSEKYFYSLHAQSKGISLTRRVEFYLTQQQSFQIP